MRQVFLATLFIMFLIRTNGSDNPQLIIEDKNPKISCVVVDKLTGETLAGVAVYVDDKLTGYTDFDGNLTIVNPGNGPHSLSTSYISYKAENTVIDTEKASSIKIEIENL